MKAVAIFPGQGSQAVGMGGALAESSPAGRDRFARASAILGYDLLARIRSGPDDVLRETRFSQPAIYVTSCALAAAAPAGFAPVATAGHSFAELCSLTLAEALDFDDGVALVAERAEAMHEAAQRRPGTMAAVLGLPIDGVREAVAAASGAGSVRLANFNAPAQIVISGDVAAVALASERATALGAKRVVALNVAGAWHSDLMAPARQRYARAVAAVPLRLPAFPVVSNVDARPYADVATMRAAIERSVTDEVRWHEAAERLLGYGPQLVVEFGGTSVLAAMMKRLPDAPPALFVGDETGVAKLAARLAEVPA